MKRGEEAKRCRSSGNIVAKQGNDLYDASLVVFPTGEQQRGGERERKEMKEDEYGG